ncbi:MAG TPA: CmcI family methyltransferase [Candidatus Limnocylindria bacterium]|jgi:cephalosporin hydroxylase|nr:CmcI family methyltransferase [Candidatus Limnocylindria bacterium]
MKFTIDTDRRTLHLEGPQGTEELPLYSDRAFDLIADQWLKVGWNQRYSYTFSWLGRPIIQLPEDMVRTQEVIHRVKPDVIIETGVAHGGSLIFYASLCKILGRGRVVGIDIEIRPHNRKAIESHELASYITLIEGSSTSPDVVAQAQQQIRTGDTVLVLLDSNHTKAHVLEELEKYHRCVTPGSYIVATDGIMKDLGEAPRGSAEWVWDNPTDAALEFVGKHPEFIIEQPAWPFSESGLKRNLTHWPGAWLKRTA